MIGNILALLILVLLVALFAWLLMPWNELSTFATDDDLKAIFAYLHCLTPIDRTASK